MERKFCSKCGKPVSMCTCGASSGRSTGFGSSEATYETAGKAGGYYIREFNNIALIDGEEVVRKYHIGEFTKGFGVLGKGSAELIVTNKRVISKQDSNYFGSSSAAVEEITLESINGVKNFFFQGYTIWRIVLAVLFLIAGLIMLFTAKSGYGGVDGKSILIGFVLIGLAVYMAISSRKPSYLFGIYSNASNVAMEMGVNMRGKMFNAQGNGIVFQYKPTTEAVTMMREIGACIVDLKNKGDYAVDAWKRRRY